MAVGLVAGMLSIFASPARATLVGSPYNGLDGTVDVHGTIQTLADLPQGSSDDSFAGGVKESDNCPALSTGSIQPNNDLTHFHIGASTVSGATFLYLGFRRAPHASVSSANYLMSFELNQSSVVCPNGTLVDRTPGDLLVAYRGDNPNQIEASRWLVTNQWGPSTVMTAGAAEGSLSSDQLFGEAVVNLNAAGIFAPGTCTSFASAFAKTRSAWSGDQSQLKDIVAPVGVTVSNCGSIPVLKTDDLDRPLGGAVFTLYTDVSDAPGVLVAPAKTCTTNAAGTCTITDIFFGTYWVVETTTPANHTTADPQKVTVASGANTPPGTRTFVNPRHTRDLTIEKTTDGGDGDEVFVFDVYCEDVDETVLFDDEITIVYEGSDTVEDLPIDATCTAVEQPYEGFSTTVTPAEGTIMITATGANTISFHNGRDAGALSILKLVDPEEDSTTFTFSVDCDNGFAESDIVLGHNGTWGNAGLPTGTECTVTEEPTDGYDTTVDPASGTVVIAEEGETYQVTFTNRRETGSLRILKEVSGTTTTSKFEFAIDCSDDAFDDSGIMLGHGEDHTVEGIPTGTECTLTEKPVAGFSTTVSPAGPVSIAADGVIYTVTFTNTAVTTPFVPFTPDDPAPTTTPTTTTTTTLAVEPAIVEATTTTVGAVLGVELQRELPRTGGDIGNLLLLAALALLLGGLALVAERPLRRPMI